MTKIPLSPLGRGQMAQLALNGHLFQRNVAPFFVRCARTISNSASSKQQLADVQTKDSEVIEMGDNFRRCIKEMRKRLANAYQFYHYLLHVTNHDGNPHGRI